MNAINRPIWFLNMCAVTDWTDSDSYMANIAYWDVFINKWIDGTMVRGNKSAEAMARVCLRLFRRAPFDLMKFKDYGNNDGLYALKKTQLRLEGLFK